MIKRPYFSSSIKELEALFENQRHNSTVIKALAHELTHRKTPRAVKLRDKALEVLSSIKTTGQRQSKFAPLTQISKTVIHLNVEYFEEYPNAIQNYLIVNGEIIASEIFADDIKVGAEVHEGSLIMELTFIFAGIGTMISNYGSLRSGIDQIINDGLWASDKITEIFKSKGVTDDDLMEVKHDEGVPGIIKKVIVEGDELAISGIPKSPENPMLNNLKAYLTQASLDLNDEDRTFLKTQIKAEFPWLKDEVFVWVDQMVDIYTHKPRPTSAVVEYKSLAVACIKEPPAWVKNPSVLTFEGFKLISAVLPPLQLGHKFHDILLRCRWF